MRSCCVAIVLTVAVLLPNVGKAQVFQTATPPPDVSAIAAPWQINGTPIMVGGLTFHPTRGFRLFDGQIMVQTGTFEGVPVYGDVTIEPFSEVYVPVGSHRMRVYERRRERELAGVPPVGTGGAVVPRAAAEATVPAEDRRPRRVSIITAAPPTPARATDGVWLMFEGARWYSDGPAVVFSPERFEPVGALGGFPVYRDKSGQGGDIWIAAVRDGAVAPYRKRP